MTITDIAKQKDPPKKVIENILKLFNSERLFDAKEIIDEQIKKYPNSSILSNICGAILVQQNEIEGSIKKYKKAISLNPVYAQAYNNLGVALQKQNKLDEAMDSYKKALKIRKKVGDKRGVANSYNNIADCLVSTPFL